MTISWNTGMMPFTDMVVKAIPKIPSNFAAMKLMPGCLVASANSWFFTVRFPTWGRTETKGI